MGAMPRPVGRPPLNIKPMFIRVGKGVPEKIRPRPKAQGDQSGLYPGGDNDRTQAPGRAGQEEAEREVVPAGTKCLKKAI